MNICSLQDLFIEELRDLHSLEYCLLVTTPQMEQIAVTPSLAQAVHLQHEQTREHIDRLEYIFHHIEETPLETDSVVFVGLLHELRSKLENSRSDCLRDAALLATLHKISHYKVASYQTIGAHAYTLGHKQLSRLLSLTLEEEVRTAEGWDSLARHCLSESSLPGNPPWHLPLPHGYYTAMARFC